MSDKYDEQGRRISDLMGKATPEVIAAILRIAAGNAREAQQEEPAPFPRPPQSAPDAAKPGCPACYKFHPALDGSDGSTACNCTCHAPDEKPAPEAQPAPAPDPDDRTPNRFFCGGCHGLVAVDEDGCCKACGADAQPVWAEGCRATAPSPPAVPEEEVAEALAIIDKWLGWPDPLPSVRREMAAVRSVIDRMARLRR